MKDVVFVTGNPEKAANFSRHMGALIPHQAVELDEIQTLDEQELVGHKARQAYEALKRPVLVEDASLSFDALGGLPGPFIKFFISLDDGDEKLCHMLDGFDNRQAQASCTYGYFDGQTLTCFTNTLQGEITERPRGVNGFGFDKIFIPNISKGKTAAELDEAEYDMYYSGVKPFSQVKEFLDD